MKKEQAINIVGGNPKNKRSAADFYPTPGNVTEALLQFLNLPQNTTIWEPACGEGDMADVMEKHGYTVKRSDILLGEDFLTCEFKECDWIITNPPFLQAEKFIRRCKEHGRPFALLLKSQYWHSKKRMDLFREITTTHIAPLTWRPDFLFKQQEKGSPLMDVMWVIWSGDNKNGYATYKPMEKPKENK